MLWGVFRAEEKYIFRAATFASGPAHSYIVITNDYVGPLDTTVTLERSNFWNSLWTYVFIIKNTKVCKMYKGFYIMNTKRIKVKIQIGFIKKIVATSVVGSS